MTAKDKQHLMWIYNRMINFYDENPQFDYMIRLKEIAESEIAKVKNKPKAAVSGSSTCPFCGGTKTKPFMGCGKSQDCKECDKDGKIKNRRLMELGLEDEIAKEKDEPRPIPLPEVTDEDIEEYANSLVPISPHHINHIKNALIIGAKWMREQMKGGVK